MITVSQTKTILAIFSSLYRHAFQDMSDGDVEVMARIWQKKLSPYELEEVERVVDYITSKSKFMPSIAEIIELLEQERNPHLKTSGLEAWNNVLDALRKYGFYDYNSASESLSQRELDIVKQIGWRKLCMAEDREMGFIQKDFIAMFEAEKEKEMQTLINNHNHNIKIANIKTMQIENRSVK